MAIIECGKGHIYDNEQHQSCPYCQGAARSVPLPGTPVSAPSKTMPLDAPGASPLPLSQSGVTLPPENYSPATPSPTALQDGKTQGVVAKKMGFSPVVGWLVCIEGPQRGKDSRIYAQVNTIGRSELNDICLKGDVSISNVNHARLSYSEQSNSFFLTPAENKNIILLNGREIFSTEKLSPYDVLHFGTSKFLFIPLCGDKFIWKADSHAAP